MQSPVAEQRWDSRANEAVLTKSGYQNEHCNNAVLKLTDANATAKLICTACAKYIDSRKEIVQTCALTIRERARASGSLLPPTAFLAFWLSVVER